MAAPRPPGGTSFSGGEGSGGSSSSGDGGIEAAIASLRSSLRPTYPEIDALYSDAYLAAALRFRLEQLYPEL